MRSPVDQRFVGGERTVIAIGRLDLSLSPRVNGVDPRHVAVLAQLDPAALPPVVVQRGTLRVVDGAHRVHAARLRAETCVAVEIVEGDDEELFVQAVCRNAEHGLPLSLEDRRSACRRILRTHPDWSNRRIAGLVGLSPNTVGSARRLRCDEEAEPTARLGRDGRVYRTGGGRAVERVRTALAANPSASVREVAATAGISVGRAHSLRRELLAARGGTGPVAPASTGADAGASGPGAEAIVALVGALAADPSLRHTEQGRALLQLVVPQALEPVRWRSLLEAVPSHRAEDVIELSQGLARTWSLFAEELRRRFRPDGLAGVHPARPRT